MTDIIRAETSNHTNGTVKNFDSIIEIEMVKMVYANVIYYIQIGQWKKQTQVSGSYLHPLLLGHFVFLQSVFFWHYTVITAITSAVYR